MIRHLLKIVWHRKRMNGLLMLEIFISFLVVFVVATAGLFLADNYRRPLGFDYRDVWGVRIDLPGVEGYAPDEAQAASFARLLEEAERLPDVVAAAAADAIPYDHSTSIYNLEADGRTVTMQVSHVSDRFAEVLGIPVAAGRWFEEADGAQPWEPLVINARLARDLFGGDDPVGRAVPFRVSEREARVVGVVADYRKNGELSAPISFLLRRLQVDAPQEHLARNLVLKMRPGADAATEEQILRRLQALAPDYSFEIRILSQMRETDHRMTLAPVLAGGLVAGFLMVMVGLGLIGVLWQNVAQRTREIGLRRAAGASGGHVRRQILVELWILTTLGLAAGVVLVAQLPILDLVGFLPGPVFAAGLVTACAVLYGLATVSGLYPSWLATRVQPAEALHSE
jgi:putative ABC transport system permease protein